MTSESSMLTQVCAAVADAGVRDFFGVVGAGNYRLVDRLESTYRLRYFAARHEATAIGAADCYARLTGRLGIGTVTQGPGLTHAVTAIVEAVKARSPLLVLAGDVGDEQPYDNQAIDQHTIAHALGAVSIRLTVSSDASERTMEAVDTARSARCPVVVHLPTSLQGVASPISSARRVPRRRLDPEAPPAEATASRLDEAAAILAAAKYPVILAGAGVVQAGAGAILRRLASEIGAILATTLPAKGLFSGDAFDVGVCGTFASAVATNLLREADVVLALGTRLNPWTTRHGQMFPGARVIHCDLLPDHIGKSLPVSLGVVADARTVGVELVERLRKRGGGERGYRCPAVAREIAAENPEASFADESSDEAIDPRTLVLRLGPILPKRRCVVIDGGHFSGFPAMYLQAGGEASLTYAHSFQTIGLGLGHALGAAVAHPDRLPIAFVGDGGLMMSLGELDALMGLRRPALVIVMNDGAYGAEYHLFKGSEVDVRHAIFGDRDFAGVARAMGANGITIRSTADLARLQDWLTRPKGLLVADCKIVRQVRAAWLA